MNPAALSAPARRKRVRAARVGLTAVGVLAGLVVVELGLRLTGFVFALRAGHGAEAPVAEAGAFRILALGESTTNRYFVQGEANDWPAQLERILNSSATGRHFAVVNHGLGGTNTAFIVAHLQDDLDQFRPDLVITMMGVNDRDLSVKYDGRPASRLRLFLTQLRTWKLLQRLWSGSGRAPDSSPDDAGCFETPNSRAQAPDREEVKSGIDALAEGRVDEGRRLFDEALRRHPESSVLYGELGRGYQNLQMHAPAIEALEKAHALDPDNCGILVDLGRAYDVAENWRGCVDMMRRALSLMTSGRRAEAALGRALASLDKCERHAGTSNPETDFFLRDRRLPLQSTDLSSGEITAYHYRELHRMLSERGVSYAAMQYPTRSVDELRKMLGDAPDVIFIENRRKFEEQCGGDRYARCFTDNFGGTFGHTTVLGHRLIAESAAEAILSRLARGK